MRRTVRLHYLKENDLDTGEEQFRGIFWDPDDPLKRRRVSHRTFDRAQDAADYGKKVIQRLIRIRNHIQQNQEENDV
jgi:hypothetical protein